MKVCIAQINFIVGDISGNTKKIIQTIESHSSQSDIIIFPELAISGYPPMDLLFFDIFLEKCHTAIETISEAVRNFPGGILVGYPRKEGGKVFNSLAFIQNGKWQKNIDKLALPNYKEFDEKRYFKPNTSKNNLIEIDKKSILVTICEDIWDNSIVEELAEKYPKIDLHINVSASPFVHNKKSERLKVLGNTSKKFGVKTVYANLVGANTDLIFDGNSMLMNENGKLIFEFPCFQEAVKTIDTEEKALFQLPQTPKTETVRDALVFGIQDFFKKNDFKKAVIGSSGGIDSALTAALAVEALGKKNVRLVTLPSSFSSQHSVDDSVELAKNLGCKLENISIKNLYEEIDKTLFPIFQGRPFSVAEENIQSRVRGLLLMALSNKFGEILLNTTNKSELAVGYGTLYGDLNGSLSVLGDVYKTEVFELAKMFRSIPENIKTKPPSAELRPEQKDSDSLPEYDTLDSILKLFIEKQKGEEEIVQQGFQAKTVKKVLQLVNQNEFKRFQSAPILKISEQSLGFERRFPLTGKFDCL